MAYDHPVLGAFRTLLRVFLRVIRLAPLSRIIADIFRDRELGGWVKAVWILLVLALPFPGIFAYLIARRQHVAGRDIGRAPAKRSGPRSYPDESRRHQDPLLAPRQGLRARGQRRYSRSTAPARQ
ncbi:PLD nuclease N-terminal domain-containing protein [Pseudofrankia sp. BMG5.37]|uniref:PLD nuclease N-terminal domain-containing protein n=1 Tax=Pseudofrankia sp. BMG5.37 TaxID=3050035 RepID=UPI0028955DFA|nr:PLD nuclease N-terminal domain-containing protein [Pseudofrankia sp. BMG5.37]MDT3439561.1 PLD nuclease N-terminal domain-containing protein [Pseudofrankia sp. BMG5.37]